LISLFEKEMKDFSQQQNNKINYRNRINLAMKSLASEEIFAHRDPIFFYINHQF